MEQADPGGALFEHASRLFDTQVATPFPSNGTRHEERFLTIAMATYDDYDGVYFSAQAIRLYHPEITADSEILVLDNHPGSLCSAALKKLESQIPGYRYVPYGNSHGTAVRDLLLREAHGSFVLVMDGHVLFSPGSLARLVSFLQEHPGSRDLYQGPMLWDDLGGRSTHFQPVWSAGMFGVWGNDERAADPLAPPFEIPMQGLGVFVCRREAWPGLNPRMSGFGGEEGYLHEKIRRQGGVVWCLPFLRWLHRFERPQGVPYAPSWKDRVRNYLIAYDELGLDPAPVVAHFEQFLGAEQARPLIEAARREIAGPYHAFDAVYSIAADGEGERWAALDLAARMRFTPAPDTPFNPEIGRVLAHRAILAEAKWQGLGRILVFERQGDASVVYEREAFDRLLAEIPCRPSAVALWLRKGASLEAAAGRRRR